MTSSEQSSIATAPEASNSGQPAAVSAVPVSPAPVAPTAAAKAATKTVAGTPAKKVAVAVKPVAKAVAPKAEVKTVVKATPKAVTQPVAKAAPKVAVKAAAKTPAKTPAKAESKTVVALAAKPKVEKLLKAKKPKLVRDSFTIPKLEYLILEELKQRGGKLGTAIKKSELIRAGVKALASMSDASFLAALKAVPAIKTGRPAKD